MLDSLSLTNGQVLMGTLNSWQKGYVSFDIKDAGVVSIQMDKIIALTCNKKLCKIITSSRKNYSGKIRSTEQGLIGISYDDTLIQVSISNIVSIVPYEISKLKPFSGFLSLGYSYSKSSAVGVINIDGNLAYSTRKYNMNLSINSMATKTDGIYYRNRDNASINIFKPINPKWEYGGRLIYQKNRQLELNARYLASGGILFDAIVKKNIELYLFSGIVTAQEYTTDGKNYNRIEIPLLLKIDIYRFNKNKIIISTMQTIYYGITSQNRIRHDGELRILYKLNDKISLTSYVYDNYDSAPVVTSSDNNDYGWVLGIRADL